MSIKSLLMPAFTQRLLARNTLLKKRAGSERARMKRGERHQVHYFHQVDDPYSALAAASLQRLVARYDIDLVAHVVSPPPDSAAPERDKLINYSRRDAQLLAQHFGLDFQDPGAQPPPDAVQRAASVLVAAIADNRFVNLAGPVSARLWRATASLGDDALGAGDSRAASPLEVAAHRQTADTLRQKLGHYLGATFFYGGEWYWGIDRLYHLERRLQELGAQRPEVQGLMFPPGADLQEAAPLANAPAIDFFFSLRSPYSAIVTPRIFALARLTGAQVRLRFVLPIVMRGLQVPRDKRMYIVHDAAREAFARGIPYGRVNDPAGRPTERGLALIPFAVQAGQGPGYLLSFMRGVWAEGMDAGSDRGLRKIVERAGLPWDGAVQALKDEAWRKTAEDNRAEMSALGLWGVPSFRVGDTAVWGQDRLWAVEEALKQGKGGASDSGPAVPMAQGKPATGALA